MSEPCHGCEALKQEINFLWSYHYKLRDGLVKRLESAEALLKIREEARHG